MVEFSKDGYKKVSMKLTTMLNGWFWGNWCSEVPLDLRLTARQVQCMSIRPINTSQPSILKHL